MGRTAVRTATLSLDVGNRLQALFGTISNAYRRLGLTPNTVPYHNFYRAMQFDTILPEHRELIMEHWERWQELYLRPEVPASDDLTISVFTMDELPEWHPDSEAFSPRRN